MKLSNRVEKNVSLVDPMLCFIKAGVKLECQQNGKTQGSSWHAHAQELDTFATVHNILFGGLSDSALLIP